MIATAVRADAIDTLTTAVDENLGRLAVVERLCQLMAANAAIDNNTRVDFGKVREEAFWRGLYDLTTATADAMEGIESAAQSLSELALAGPR